jgi:hypothetical protein
VSRRRRKGSPASTRTRPSATLDTVVAVRTAQIALALVLLAGCGGGSGAPLTKEEYASKADAICASANSKIQSFGTPQTYADLAKVADKTLPLIDQAIKDLGKLEPPASEKAISDQWLAQWRNLRGDLQEIRDAAKTGNTQAVKALVPKATEHNSKTNALATQLGMSVCNKD